MQFRKIAALAGSAVMAGATLAGAALAATVNSVGEITTKLGTPEEGFPIFVIGSGAKEEGAASDVAAAIDIAVRLAANSKTPKEVPVEGIGPQVTVTGGKMLETESKKLYGGSSINDAVESLDYQELQDDILKSGEITVGGDTYTYDQYLKIGDAVINFGKPGDEENPVQYVQLHDTDPTVDNPSDYLVEAVVSFSDTVNLKDAEGKEITLFGKKFTIGPGTDNTTLELLSEAEEVPLSMGETKTVEVGGKTYTIELLGKNDQGAAVLKVNGEVKTANKGEYIEDYEDLYVKDVTFYTQGGDTLYGSVTILAGSKKITLKDGNKVKIDDDEVDGTKVGMNMNNGELSWIKIAFDTTDDTNNYIKAGETWTDPVFGTIKVAFHGLDSTEREEINVKPSGDYNYKLFFTDKSGNNVDLTFANMEQSYSTPKLEVDAKKGYVLVEGAPLYEGNYTILSGTEGREIIVKVSDVSYSDKKVELQNVVTGDTIEIKLNETGQATKPIGLTDYYFTVTSDNELRITWGDSAGYGNPGSDTVVYPTVTTSKGAKVALLGKVTIQNNTAVLLPGESTPVAVTCDANPQTIPTSINVNYTIVAAGSDKCDLYPSAPVNLSTNPGVMVIEEEATTPTGETQQRAIIISITKDSDKLKLGDVKFSEGNVEFYDTSQDYVFVAADLYGTAVTKDTEDQGEVTISYPDNQVVAKVAVGSNPQFTTGGAGTVKTEVVVPVTADVAKLDIEVNDAMKQNYDLIVVGGPCVNRIAAELLGKTYPACGAESGIPENAAIVKVFPNFYAEGKTAVLVAGWEADNTKKAAMMIQSGEVEKSEYASRQGVKIKDSSIEELIVAPEMPAENTTAQ